jgi:glycine oxidase
MPAEGRRADVDRALEPWWLSRRASAFRPTHAFPLPLPIAGFSRGLIMHSIESEYCVVGGGIAGLTVARAIARAGATVAIVERGAVGRGAAYQAAGMLAPMVEARLQEQGVIEFMLEALEFYRGFAAEIEAETGIDIALSVDGSLLVAVDRDDAEKWRHRFEEYRAMNLPVEWLSGYECRELEPFLAPGIPGGMISRADQQVDNRRLLEALVASCSASELVTIVDDAGEGELIVAGGHAVAFRTPVVEVRAARFVVATGARVAWMRETLPEIARAIRPVKGQIIRLDQRRMPLVTHLVRTPDMYLAPKADGTLVLGATSEEKGFDASITAGEIMELLRHAWETVPGIFELPITETGAEFRPATIDHAPLLGATSLDNVDVATGYFRHGILVAPYAAQILAARRIDGTDNRWLDQFSPSRLTAYHE